MNGLEGGLKLVELVPSAVTAILVIFVVMYLTKQAREQQKDCAESNERAATTIVGAIDRLSDRQDTSLECLKEETRGMGDAVRDLREYVVRIDTEHARRQR